MPRKPLEGIRVIDSTYVFAMPYAAGLLTDLGAEVIKVEGVLHPDRSAAAGSPDNYDGDDPWNRGATFNQLNRGKRSLTLDLSKEEGRDAFKDLVRISDVVIENYTPRVMRRWEMDYPNLRKIKPDIIMMSNTGYGHGDGPYAAYPGQATTMEATHGLCWVTGYQGEFPSKAGQSYVDFLACFNGLFAVAAALRHRNRTGKGQWIDLGMYQVGVYWTSEHIMDYIANQRLGGSMGNRHPWRAPQGCYPCKGDDNWCVLSVGDDEEWMALCKAMNKLELTDDPRFMTNLDRRRNHDELDELISSWSKTHDKFEVMEALQNVGVPAGPVFTSKDANLNPHYWERGFLEKVTWPAEQQGMDTRVLMGRPWQLSKVPLNITEPTHAFGRDNRYVLQELFGKSDADVARMEESQMIGNQPLIGSRRGAPYVPPNPGQQAAQAQRGNAPPVGRAVTFMDPDYKKLLGI